MKLTSMLLYMKPSCPYCVKVMNFCNDHDIELDMVNIEEPKYREELVNLTGKTQVPCLVVGDHPMLESDDIIAFLTQVISG